MATLAQATQYNSVRSNHSWEALPNDAAQALLQDAEDYIRSVYNVGVSFDAETQRMFDNLVCRLAAVFQTKPPVVASAPAIKRENKEGAGFKKEVEYVAQAADPYPFVTAAVRPFLLARGGSVTMGRMSR